MIPNGPGSRTPQPGGPGWRPAPGLAGSDQLVRLGVAADKHHRVVAELRHGEMLVEGDPAATNDHPVQARPASPAARVAARPAAGRRGLACSVFQVAAVCASLRFIFLARHERAMP